MKIALFDEHRIGVIENDVVRDITELVGWNSDRPQESLLHLMAGFSDNIEALRANLPNCPSSPLSTVKLCPPVPDPSKIVAAPVNYRLHQDEMNAQFNNAEYTIKRLGFFLKAPSSIIGPRDTVILPFRDRRTDHEAEIAFVVGKEAKDVPASEAWKYIFGYFALMDITVRGKEDRPWRKSFDTFTPIGPWIVTTDEIGDPSDLDIKLWVNNEIRQSTNTRNMIYDCYEFFEAVTSVMTLRAGDIVTTGTPEGVGPIVGGDTVRIQIQRIGEFSVNVVYKQ